MMPISAVLVRGKFALATFGPGRASKYIYDADDGLVTVRPVLDRARVREGRPALVAPGGVAVSGRGALACDRLRRGRASFRRSAHVADEGPAERHGAHQLRLILVGKVFNPPPITISGTVSGLCEISVAEKNEDFLRALLRRQDYIFQDLMRPGALRAAGRQ